MGAVRDLQERLASYIDRSELGHCSEFHAGPPYPKCRHDSHSEGRALLAIVMGAPEVQGRALRLVDAEPEVAAGP